VFVLVNGWACSYRVAGDGERQIISLFVAGDVLNLPALAQTGDPFGIICLSAATVVAIPCTALRFLANKTTSIASSLLELSSIDNQRLARESLRARCPTACQRLAHLLCELQVRLVGVATASFKFPLTQEVLANTLGLSQVHFSRIWQQLRTTGLLEVEGDILHFPNLADIRKLAEFDPSCLETGVKPRDSGSPRSVAIGNPLPREIVPNDQMGGHSHYELLLQETRHRCGNDLQLISALLSMQARRAQSQEVRAALADATTRIAVLARARSDLARQHFPRLREALQQVCEGLHSQAEPRGISVTLYAQSDLARISPDQIALLALAVNELITNAIKHAFAEGRSGHIKVQVRRDEAGAPVVSVDDDGLPFAERNRPGGFGLELVERLVRSADAQLIAPCEGSKCFVIRLAGPNSRTAV
jgi:two-component sensor histidine kinase